MGDYDIVIANNVLHATEDIVQAVRHARALLRPGGVLVLNELARNDWWSHLTFGLLEGWWRFTDGRRIQGGPALSSNAWREVLRECGFDTVELLAEPPVTWASRYCWRAPVRPSRAGIRSLSRPVRSRSTSG